MLSCRMCSVLVVLSTATAAVGDSGVAHGANLADLNLSIDRLTTHGVLVSQHAVLDGYFRARISLHSRSGMSLLPVSDHLAGNNHHLNI